DEAPYRLHPALLDSCLQVIAGALPPAERALWVPTDISTLRLHRRPTDVVWCHARLAPRADGRVDELRADIVITGGQGEAIAEVGGLALRRVASGIAMREETSPFLALEWAALPVPPWRIESGRWLIIGEGGGVGASLAAALASTGHEVVHAV